MNWAEQNKCKRGLRKKQNLSLAAKLNRPQFSLPGWFHHFQFVQLCARLWLQTNARVPTQAHWHRNCPNPAWKEHVVFHLWRTIEHLSQLFKQIYSQHFDDFSGHTHTHSVIISAWFTSSNMQVCCLHSNPSKSGIQGLFLYFFGNVAFPSWERQRCDMQQRCLNF